MSHNRSKRVPPRGINTIFIFYCSTSISICHYSYRDNFVLLVHSTVNFRPVDKLCPGKRLCRMEWERARKKTPVGVRRKLVSSFLSLMRLRKGGSGLPLPLFLAGKAWPNCSPIFALQMFLRSRSAVCAALFGTAGFPIHQYPPGSLSKIIALYVLGVAFPNALRPHRADIAIRLFRIVNPPQPSGQPSKIPQLQFFPLRAAIQIVFLIVDKGRGIAFPQPLVSLSRGRT